MQEYRKKMEEQKRLREKLLREKENRRKLAAMEKQNENARNDPSAAGECSLSTHVPSVGWHHVRTCSLAVSNVMRNRRNFL